MESVIVALANFRKIDLRTAVQAFKGGMGYSINIMNIASIFIGSPNSLLNLYHIPGTEDQKRAYPTNDPNIPPYYEWELLPGSKTRKVTYFMDYDFINGTWRGVFPTGQIDYFNENGNKILSY